MLTAVVISGCGQSSTEAGQGSQQVAPSRSETVSFRTPDGLKITGDFRGAPGTKAVLLLPQWGQAAESWYPYVEAIAGKGINVLVIDPRGYHRSQRQGNQSVEPTWDIQVDIAGAIAYLKTTRRMTSIGIAGASYGANNALIFAASHSDIKAVVLLSPGKDYHGLTIDEPSKTYKGPILVLASKGDSGMQGGPQIIKVNSPNTEVMEYEGNEHGTALLAKNEDAVGRLVNFLDSKL